MMKKNVLEVMYSNHELPVRFHYGTWVVKNMKFLNVYIEGPLSYPNEEKKFYAKQ